MANNFRIPGDFYVSKGGHDSNDGLTPDTPKKSIIMQDNTYNMFVVGAGYYNDLIMSSNRTMTADGLVIVDYGGSTELKIVYLSNAGKIIGFILKNANNLSLRYDGSLSAIQNCIIQNCSLAYHNKQYNARSTIFCNVSNINAGSGTSDYCIFLNTTTANLAAITNTYCDIATIVRCANIINPNSFFNNNIQGLILIDSIFYAIQDQFIGTPQDNGYAADVYWLNEANLTANGYTGTIAGWDVAVATCINRDPKFNNASKLDFTLQADSPHIGRASDGFSNIGGTEYAQSFYAGISNPNILLFDVSEAIDTTTNNNDWRLKPGYTEGWIRVIVKVSNNDVQISSIPYIGNYAFDSDQAGGSSTNMNVPDSKPITNEYPDYLTVTTQAANDTTLIIAGHGAVVGDWLWVDGQYREITGVPDADTVTFATSLRAIVIVGTVVKIGTFEALASLNPNRLNMKMRSSKLADVNASNWDNPLTWDNDGLSPAGQYMAQEWNNAPMIDSLNEVGFGDDSYDANYGNPINLKVVDIMIYLRNNYRS